MMRTTNKASPLDAVNFGQSAQLDAVVARLRPRGSQLLLVTLLVLLGGALVIVGDRTNRRITDRTAELDYQLQRVSGDRLSLERQVMSLGLTIEHWLDGLVDDAGLETQRQLTARQIAVTQEDALSDPLVAAAMRDVLAQLDEVDEVVARGRDLIGPTERNELRASAGAAIMSAKRLFDANEHENFVLVHRLDTELQAARRTQWAMIAMVVALVVVLYLSVNRIFRSNYRLASLALREEHDRYSAAMSDRTRAERRYREVVDQVSDVVFRSTIDGRWTLLNKAWESLAGRPVAAALGQFALASCHPDDRARVAAGFLPLVDGDVSNVTIDCRQLRPDGATRLIRVRAHTSIDETSGERYVAGTINDVTAQLTAEQLSSAQTKILELIAGGAPTQHVLDRIEHELQPFAMNTSMRVSTDERHIPPGARRVRLRDVAGGATPGAIWWTGDAGNHDPELPEIVRLAARLAALAVERQLASEQLAYQATHDQLTGLPNRVLLADRLSAASTRVRRSGTKLAVMFLDIDRFKTINDAHGHSAGDRLLLELGGRLAGVVRATDTVARFGGDEFVIVAEDITVDDATALARSVFAAIARPVALGGVEAHVSTSIGLVVDDGSMTNDALLLSADIAMYRAKHGGRARIEVFDPEMKRWSERRQAIEADLRLCVRDERLVVWYQPVFHLASGELTGFEALVRWNRPGVGIVAPGEFIGIAEEIGMIRPIGRWVLNTALCQLAEWQQTQPDLTMSINVSGTELMSDGFLESVGDAVSVSAVDPRGVILEITESVLLEGALDIPRLLGELRRTGIRVAIDDFGTGYSSLRYLRDLPVDILKIDRTFVSASDVGLTDTAIVTSVADLGHALGLDVVAEGIETTEQFEALRTIGVDHGQGYLYGRPAPASEMALLIEDRCGASEPDYEVSVSLVRPERRTASARSVTGGVAR